MADDYCLDAGSQCSIRCFWQEQSLHGYAAKNKAVNLEIQMQRANYPSQANELSECSPAARIHSPACVASTETFFSLPPIA